MFIPLLLLPLLSTTSLTTVSMMLVAMCGFLISFVAVLAKIWTKLFEPDNPVLYEPSHFSVKPTTPMIALKTSQNNKILPQQSSEQSMISSKQEQKALKNKHCLLMMGTESEIQKSHMKIPQSLCGPQYRKPLLDSSSSFRKSSLEEDVDMEKNLCLRAPSSHVWGERNKERSHPVLIGIRLLMKSWFNMLALSKLSFHFMSNPRLFSRPKMRHRIIIKDYPKRHKKENKRLDKEPIPTSSSHLLTKNPKIESPRASQDNEGSALFNSEITQLGSMMSNTKESQKLMSTAISQLGIFVKSSLKPLPLKDISAHHEIIQFLRQKNDEDEQLIKEMKRCFGWF
ncbi:MAG: hypothetical protein NTW94_09655 [Legionellales bacterium]|nr:hypothetical protein [Legionellales bacterium]